MKLKLDKFNKILAEVSIESEARILDIAKDKSELEQVAKKADIVFPSPDLAIFKSKYAFLNVANRNGCVLTKEEVQPSLASLTGKAIDFDHIRQRVVGHWLYAELDKDTIVAYGIFFKSNFADDFVIIKDLMEKGNLKVSFEAWGTREFIDDKTYELKDIVWAGGGLLITTKPAFDDSEVTEMAQARILEFANTMTLPENFVRLEKATPKKPDITENFIRLTQKIPSQFQENSFRIITISKAKGIKAVIGKLKGESTTTVQTFLFDKDKWLASEAQKWVKEHKSNIEQDADKGKCFEDARFNIFDVDWIIRLIHEIKPKDGSEHGWHDIRVIDFDKGIIKTLWMPDELKMTIDINPRPIKSSADNTDSKNKTEVTSDMTLEEQIKKLEADIATLNSTVANLDAANKTLKEEKAKVEKALEDSRADTEKANKDLVDEKASKDKAIEDAKKDAKTIAERRAELGEEHVKDMKDEDILNDDKFENAKLKKENVDLKHDKDHPNDTPLYKGSQNANDTTDNEEQESRNKITKLAFENK